MLARKILIVDDEPEIVELVALVLEGLDLPLLVAYDGAEALEVVQREHPCVVITDLMMPRLNGRELCRNIREDPATQSTEVLYISAASPPNAEGCCAQRFIRKPFDVGELLEDVEEMLAHQAT